MSDSLETSKTASSREQEPEEEEDHDDEAAPRTCVQPCTGPLLRRGNGVPNPGIIRSAWLGLAWLRDGKGREETTGGGRGALLDKQIGKG